MAALCKVGDPCVPPADDLVKKLPEDVASEFGVIIADESHALKTPTAQRTQVRLLRDSDGSLNKHPRMRGFRTGTSLLASEADAWLQ